jgi:UDP-N-acetylglucosamine 2-epimerase (non-hydrolysing)
MEPRSTVLVVVGSRPEAIKLSPVVRELGGHAGGFKPVICVTGQQRDLIPQALAEFGFHADVDLAVMQLDQSLAGLTARLMTGLDRVLTERRPDWVLVQGDTTSAMVGALAGFYHNVPVGHVEAGLRTGDPRAPFPEEVNRRLITQCATLHFAPTVKAEQNLLAEGVPASRVFVTGNTVVDAVLWIRDECRNLRPELPPAVRSLSEKERLVLVTSHRREHFGRDIEDICQALVRLSRSLPDLLIVYPVHPNPNVREPVERILGAERRIALVDPLPYRSFIALLDRASLVLTDSGGIQEEAPSFGKPVLVLRRKTERTEGVDAGTARLVGPDADAIVAAAVELLTDERAYNAMARIASPYGDGHAARRIVTLLETWNQGIAVTDAAPAAR